MTPFPGSILFRRLEREGRILHRDWPQYDILHVTYQFRSSGFAALARRTYSSTEILRRALRLASRARKRPVVRQPWLSRVARIVSPNLYYRAITAQCRPSDRGARSTMPAAA